MWQYLWTPEPVAGPVNLEDGQADHRGIGMFMRAGLADRDTNPIEWTVSGGLGGRRLRPPNQREGRLPSASGVTRQSDSAHADAMVRI